MSPQMNPENDPPGGSEPPPLVLQPAPPVDAIGRPMRQQPPVRWREILAVVLLVALADAALFRAHGFAGYGAFFLLAPMLLWMGAPRSKHGQGFWLLAILMLLLVAKMLWCGSWLLVGSGFVLLVGFSMALAGMCPHVLETIVFGSQSVLAGYEGLVHYRRSTEKLGPVIPRGAWLNFGLPAAALMAFGLLFVVANPDLAASFGETVRSVVTTLREWILQISPDWKEVLFWCVVLWIAVGLLRPVLRPATPDATPDDDALPETGPVPALLYVPFRNTLLTVIVLFAVYLVFEFKTLWLRVFPEGFYYSGYAHEGAAWLTVALALATLVLSLIFRGRILQDARQGRLRRLAWIWSLENMLLAAAVYNRLHIYIGFNGMTRMRTVALFGMTCVVAGFVLVIWKIVHNHDLTWLLRRHLWALALTVFLYALTPVDVFVHDYNVRRILSGDPAPAVQITEHPISAEGIPRLLPLLDCENETIREGIRAMLAERLDRAEYLEAQNQRQGWTTYQAADRRMLECLRANAEQWEPYTDRRRRGVEWQRFRAYAYQWY